MDFDASSLHDQFLISRGRTIEAANWQTQDHGDWIISHHESLPLIGIRTADGARIGCFLGFPISEEGQRITGKCRAPFSSPATISDEQLEEFVYSFGGRFACLLDFGETGRLYLDACASLALVYSRDRSEAASTTTVLGSTARYGEEWLGAGMEGFPGRKGFFPAGLTGDPDIRRLLPGHYLDLRAWSPRRHWPPKDFQSEGPESVPDHIERIVGSITANVAGIVRDYDTYISLTRGMDSRMLLACSREFLDRISFFTFRWGERSARDEEGASYLARHFDLDHRILGPDTGESLREEWNFRTGFCGATGKAPFFLGAARRDLDLRRAWIIAHGGEVGRAILIEPSDRPEDPSNPIDFLNRLDLPTNEVFVAAMDEWLRGLEWADQLLRLELMLIEHQWACHASTQLYGFAPFAVITTPFSHRAILESMLKLPLDYRRARQVTVDVVRRAWPEIAGIPFEPPFEPGGRARRLFRRVLHRGRKLARRAAARSGLGGSRARDEHRGAGRGVDEAR